MDIIWVIFFIYSLCFVLKKVMKEYDTERQRDMKWHSRRYYYDRSGGRIILPRE